MENLNKVLSFALGLVVVVVFLAIISGKIDLRKKIPLLSGKTTEKTSLTPTPTPAPSSVSVEPEPTIYTNYKDGLTIGKTTSPKTIPATGSPTILIPVLFSSLTAGIYLRKKDRS